jgi:AAA+ ATPase superfamily predicted ATPase
MPKRPNNPFIITGYWGRPYFCDREDVLEWLDEQVLNERNVVLHSWRRMGKTALIRLFFEDKEAERTVGIYVDLLGTRSMEDAIRAIVQAVHERFGRTSSGLTARFQQLIGHIGATISIDPGSGVPQLRFDPRNPPEPDPSLEALGDFLQERDEEMIIALDEFQQVTRYSEENAEARFRTWVQSYPELRFIFSGSQRNMMRSLFQEKKRPFYGSAQIHGIGPIPEDAYIPFIQGHFKDHGKWIDEGVVRELLAWSRGQTYCVQLLCNLLFASCDRPEKADLLNVQGSALEQDEAWFHQIGRSLTDMQWKLLKALAKEEPVANPLAQDLIAPYALGAASSVNTALKALLDKELIVRTEEGYRVHEVLLGRWLDRI